MKNRIIKQIEELLYREEYVVVPGLGTFLRRTLPSEIDESKGLIYPPKQALAFNSLLSQSDGMLKQCYTFRYGISSKRADALIREDVQDLITSLKKSGIIEVGSLGKLWLNGSGKIIYSPASNHPYSTAFFGYSPVVSLSTPTIERRQTHDTDNSIERLGGLRLPLGVRDLKYGIAATILLFALFFFPKELPYHALNTKGIPQYQAGFMNLGKESEESLNEDTNSDQYKTKATSQIVMGTVANHSFLPVPRVDSKQNVDSNTSDAILGVSVLKPDRNSSKTKYYIVIATLRSKEAVEKFLSDNKQVASLPEIGILLTNRTSNGEGTYRIYSNVSDTKQDAFKEMKALHLTSEHFADAWVYQYPLSK